MNTFIGSVKLICNKCDGNDRIKWDEYFASMALLASSRSPCERLHVGCVIVKDNRVLSMGYNGFFSVLLIFPLFVMDTNKQLYMQNKMQSLTRQNKESL